MVIGEWICWISFDNVVTKFVVNDRTDTFFYDNNLSALTSSCIARNINSCVCPLIDSGNWTERTRISVGLNMMFQYWYTDDFVKTNLVKFIGVTNMQCSRLVCVAIYFILNRLVVKRN